MGEKSDNLSGFIAIVDGKVYTGLDAINKFSEFFCKEYEKFDSYIKAIRSAKNSTSPTPLFKVKKPLFEKKYKEK